MRHLTPLENIGREEPQPTEACRLMSYEEQIADLTDQQVLQQYEVRVRFLDKGCVVSLGCKEIAFGNPKLAIEAVTEYINNPKDVSRNWREVFNMK